MERWNSLFKIDSVLPRRRWDRRERREREEGGREGGGGIGSNSF